MTITAESIARAQALDEIDRQKAEDQARKNYHFLQLDKSSIKELRRLIRESPKAAQLLTILAEKMNRQNAIVMSQPTMMEITGWSRPTVSKAIRTLREEQWVQVLKIGTANAYLINNTVFWQDAADKKHACFSAEIIATATEQDQSVEQMSKLKLKSYPFAEVRESNAKGAKVLIGGKATPPDQTEMDL